MQEALHPNWSGDRPLDVVVVGGSQADLAMAWHLARRGLRFVVLEAGPGIGHVWRSGWDSLKLFTPAQYNALPGMPFPAPADTYPTKDPVADYLQAYATAHDLPVRLNARVTDLKQTGEGFEVRTAGEGFRARQVVVATGPFQAPFVPPAAERLDASVTQVHSSQYRNPQALPGGPVLVVGGGNSGFQIAEELAATRQVDLSVGTKYPMLPQRLGGKDLFWWLTRLGLMRVTAASRLGRRVQARGEFVIGSNRRRLERAGVRFRPRLEDADGRTVRFADGSTPGGRRGGGVGDRLPLRLRLDPHARRGRRRLRRPPAWCERGARPVLPRPVVAAHPRLGPAWLRQRRRRLPGRPRRPAARHRCGRGRHRPAAVPLTSAHAASPQAKVQPHSPDGTAQPDGP
jgi:putative flavoprotein involved in K+ transport